METTMTDDLAVVTRYCDAWMVGDLHTVLDSYHADLTLDWPGEHALAGRHEGLDAALTALARLADLTGRVPTAIRSMYAGPTGVVAVVEERWTDGEASLTVERALEFRVADGKIVHCRIFEFHQGAIDEWLTSRS